MRKRWFLVGMMFLLLSWLMVGCGISQEVYDAVVAERDSFVANLQSVQGELDAAKSELQSIQGELESSELELQSVASELEAAQSELDTAKAELQMVKEELNEKQTELNVIDEKLKAMKSDMETMALYLTYERIDALWQSGELSEEEAALAMEETLIELDNDNILNSWDLYQASTTEKEMEERNYIFSRTYFRELDKFMDEITEKYALWENS